MTEFSPFGNAQDPSIVPCAVCGDSVEHVDKYMVEKEIIHKSCFICAFCDTRLQVGYCVQELALYNRYGPCWYCSLICAHRPLAEKEAKLKEKGVEVRNPATRRPKPKAAAQNAPAAGQQAPAAPAAPAEPAPVVPAADEAPAQEVPPAAQEENQEIEAVEVKPEEASTEQKPAEPAEADKEGSVEAEEVVAPPKPEEAPPAPENAPKAEAENANAEPPVAATTQNEPSTDDGDGPEMEAELVKPANDEASEEAPKAEEAPVVIEQSAEVAGEPVEQPSSTTEAAEPAEEAPVRKESKSVPLDAYENKYRLQMKKKK